MLLILYCSLKILLLNYQTVWSSKLQICLISSLVSTPYWHAVYHALSQVNVKKWAFKVLSTLDDCAFLRIFVAIVIIPETRKKCIQAFDIVKILKLMNMHTFAFIYGCVLRQCVHWTGILHLTYAYRNQNILCDLFSI